MRLSYAVLQESRRKFRALLGALQTRQTDSLSPLEDLVVLGRTKALCLPYTPHKVVLQEQVR